MSIKNIDLGYRPRPWQQRIHREKKRWNICVAHRRAGKTWLTLHELVHCALEHPKRHLGYMAPFLGQAKKVMWLPLRETALKIPHTEVRETDLMVIFPNGSIIRCMGADNDQAARGLGFDGLVVDEFQLFDPTTLPLVLLPTLAGRNGWLFQIGTPTGIDPLTEAYDRAKGDPEWACWKFKATETGVLTDDELNAQKKMMTEQQFNMEFMCEFDAGSPNQLFSGEMIENAFKREYEYEQYKDFARVMSCDIARQGNDNSVIFRRMGPMTWEPVVFSTGNLMEAARIIASEYNAFKPDALFIDGGGIGAGVVDSLRDMGIPVIEVQFGGRPVDDRYMNARSEMYHNLYRWLREGGRLHPSYEIKMELTGLRYSQDDKGKLRLEAKEDMRKRGMRSPDRADALAASFFMPVTSRNEMPRSSAPTMATDNWEL